MRNELKKYNHFIGYHMNIGRKHSNEEQQISIASEILIESMFN